MSVPTLTSQARMHWAKWLPSKTRSLKAEGMFEVATQDAAVVAQEQIDALMQQGYQEHEAAEVVLRELILLPPETSARETSTERAELLEMERLYLRAKI